MPWQALHAVQFSGLKIFDTDDLANQGSEVGSLVLASGLILPAVRHAAGLLLLPPPCQH